MDRTDPNTGMLHRALGYAAAGIAVFPCVPEAKNPLTANGFHDATTDPAVITAWWARHPQANIATPTGVPGVDVLDVDVRPNGTGWPALHHAKASGLVDGWLRAIRTPSGGLHLHYPGTAQRNATLRGQHLDFRGHGGYVLLPPSRVTTDTYTGSYTLLRDQPGAGRHLDWTAITALLDPPARQHLAAPTRVREISVARLADFVARQPEGNRDNALFWAACRAAEAGHDPQPLLDAAGVTGLPERQARRTVRSAYDTITRTASPQPPTAISR